MSVVTISCDQAIFTSIRSPMGEGYRIVAASGGLTAAEKQAITRSSPSHESMCVPQAPLSGEPIAVAFYSLPSGRLCVSYSCPAGAEHTGRGGDRVYTLCLAFASEAFARIGFNPFHIVRAMADAGLTTPQLKPAAVLPALQLAVSLNSSAAPMAALNKLAAPHRGAVLGAPLDERAVILDLPADWVECAEAVLLGLPGPGREKITFSAGLKFSSSRRHQLQFLRDEKSVLRARLADEPVEWIDPREAREAPPADSAWLRFVERHWARGEWRELDRRTSKCFTDISRPALERFGIWYQTTDSLAERPPLDVLNTAAETLEQRVVGVESDVCRELVDRAQHVLSQKVGLMAWPDAEPLWRRATMIWRRSPAGAQFAEPILQGLLKLAATDSLTTAARAALLLENEPAPSTYLTNLRPQVDELLSRLGQWMLSADGAGREHADNVVSRWVALRPKCPIVQAIPRPAAAAL